jgi:hypothetical protein
MLARRGEIVTKTQKLRPALSCEPLPNHVLPLAHFGATSDVCDGGVVRTDHHNAGERSGLTKMRPLKLQEALKKVTVGIKHDRMGNARQLMGLGADQLDAVRKGRSTVHPAMIT